LREGRRADLEVEQAELVDWSPPYHNFSEVERVTLAGEPVADKVGGVLAVGKGGAVEGAGEVVLDVDVWDCVGEGGLAKLATMTSSTRRKIRTDQKRQIVFLSWSSAWMRIRLCGRGGTWGPRAGLSRGAVAVGARRPAVRRGCGSCPLILPSL
jgi:hypothetical protein